MSQIDVTELLSDPDFVDQIQVIYRRPTVDTQGQNLLDEYPIDGIGCVQPADKKTIERLPPALIVENLMGFWFQGRITASQPGQYTTILVFKGQRYEVKSVFDWSMAGAGWSEGVCVAEVPAP